MKFKDGYMVSSGQPVNEYIDSAVRHVLLRQVFLDYIFFICDFMNHFMQFHLHSPGCSLYPFRKHGFVISYQVFDNHCRVYLVLRSRSCLVGILMESKVLLPLYLIS